MKNKSKSNQVNKTLKKSIWERDYRQKKERKKKKEFRTNEGRTKEKKKKR